MIGVMNFKVYETVHNTTERSIKFMHFIPGYVIFFNAFKESVEIDTDRKTMKTRFISTLNEFSGFTKRNILPEHT